MRIAITLDDELLCRRFAERAGRDARVHFPVDADELRRLAMAGAVDVAVVGALKQDDDFWAATLCEIARAAPQVAIVGVLDSPLGPALHEALDLVREVPAINFVDRPDARFAYLARHRAPDSPPVSLTPTLLDCIQSLPLANIGRDFATLQALRPSAAYGIAEQVAALGVGRRKLERWFQGPDLCSPRRLQAVCAAGEALFLRRVHSMHDWEVAGVVGILSEDGTPNPLGVGREIRSVFGEYRQQIRERGMAAVEEAVHAELRKAQDSGHAPARWSPGTRYLPAHGILVVPKGEQRILVDPIRRLEYALDGFGEDSWGLIARGAILTEMTNELALRRGEPRNRLRARLKCWLSELLLLGLIRRDPDGARASERA